MNAIEARKIAKEFKSEETKIILDEVEKDILKSANGGKFNLCYFKKLTPTVERILEEKGFKINYVEEVRGESYHNIDWSIEKILTGTYSK